ncbi:uncharacterized protein LOC127463512 [Manacus candei]|uniref:uncharacterized protein LOC127463512 n=1 Tax=Manacus candei TaxID=415023 RepID=UPI002226A9F9|nr:uncharacterized protein LOC127463512 [Manacus candei]
MRRPRQPSAPAQPSPVFPGRLPPPPSRRPRDGAGDTRDPQRPHRSALPSPALSAAVSRSPPRRRADGARRARPNLRPRRSPGRAQPRRRPACVSSAAPPASPPPPQQPHSAKGAHPATLRCSPAGTPGPGRAATHHTRSPSLRLTAAILPTPPGRAGAAGSGDRAHGRGRHVGGRAVTWAGGPSRGRAGRHVGGRAVTWEGELSRGRAGCQWRPLPSVTAAASPTALRGEA